MPPESKPGESEQPESKPTERRHGFALKSGILAAAIIATTAYALVVDDAPATTPAQPDGALVAPANTPEIGAATPNNAALPANTLPPGHPPIDGPMVTGPMVTGPTVTGPMVDLGDGALPPGHPPIGAHADGPATVNPHVAAAGNTQKLRDPTQNVRTIATVFAERRALCDSEQRVRGKVVKRTAGVLERTWLHLQDGSGDPSRGDHDLVVTTTGDAALGAVVTVEGKVACDRDLGSGYRYDVLLEDAVVRE